MKRLIAGVALVATLTVASPASSNPAYWYKSQRTAAHGWVVKAGNDTYNTTIRTRCHWSAGGQNWHLSWLIGPRDWYWTASDAGSYGNYAPVGLACTYVRVS